MEITKTARKRVRVTNRRQYDRMVKFMVDHPAFATYAMGTTERNKFLYKKLWDDLSEQLNMRGPPVRNTEEWKKVWVDYKHNIKKKCYIKQKFERNQQAGGTEDYKNVNFSDNEAAIKQLIFDSPPFSKFPDSSPNTFLVINASPTTSKATLQVQEIPIIKTELSDMLLDATEFTDQLHHGDTISPPGSPSNFEITSTFGEEPAQPNVLDDLADIDKHLNNLRKEKIKISKQTTVLKQRHLEKLQELRERKYDIKCEQFKYKSLKMELKNKELQRKGTLKQRNSIRVYGKFKKHK